MRMASYITVLFLVLVLMEGAAWMAFKSSNEENLSVPKSEPEIRIEPRLQQEEPKQEGSKARETSASNRSSSLSTTGMGGNNDEGFPGPTTEVVNGRIERTIHMGVRQYVWDPTTINAQKGELVRLIIHNADVLHGLVIPELGVNQDIPSDGAVVEFIASRVGSFEFFCSIWCGEGHMEMRGRLVIE